MVVKMGTLCKKEDYEELLDDVEKKLDDAQDRILLTIGWLQDAKVQSNDLYKYLNEARGLLYDAMDRIEIFKSYLWERDTTEEYVKDRIKKILDTTSQAYQLLEKAYDIMEELKKHGVQWEETADYDMDDAISWTYDAIKTLKKALEL